MEKTSIAPSYFDGTKVTSVQKKMFAIIVLGYFFDQLDNYTMAFVAPALIESWNVTMTDIGQINSLYFIGMLIGGFAGGWASDFMGRKKSFIYSIIFFSLFSFCNTLAPNLIIFNISRLMKAIGIASMTVISLAYIAEISPAESRGKWMALIGGIGVIAVPLVGVMARLVIPLAPWAWRIIFFAGSLGIFAAIIGFSWLKESPRWLVAQGRTKEAEQIIEEIIHVKMDLSAGATESVPKANMLAEIADMFRGILLKRTLVLLTLSCIAFAGAFIFLSWAPTLLKERGYSLEDSLLIGTIFSLGTPLGALLAAPLSDKGGRKIPLVLGCLVGGALAVVYGLMDTKYAIIGVGLAFWLCLFFMGTVLFAYIPENYPTRIRNTASGFIWSVGRIGTAVVQLLVPAMYAQFGYGNLFAIVGGSLVFVAVVVGIWGIKTAGCSLEEINQEVPTALAEPNAA